jgi:hypothetical protein
MLPLLLLPAADANEDDSGAGAVLTGRGGEDPADPVDPVFWAMVFALSADGAACLSSTAAGFCCSGWAPLAVLAAT